MKNVHLIAYLGDKVVLDCDTIPKVFLAELEKELALQAASSQGEKNLIKALGPLHDKYKAYAYLFSLDATAYCIVFSGAEANMILIDRDIGLSSMWRQALITGRMEVAACFHAWVAEMRQGELLEERALKARTFGFAEYEERLPFPPRMPSDIFVGDGFPDNPVRFSTTCKWCDKEVMVGTEWCD